MCVCVCALISSNFLQYAYYFLLHSPKISGKKKGYYHFGTKISLSMRI